MAETVPRDRVTLGELHGYMWPVIAVVALSVVYAVLQVGFVRPYLWPAGTGALLDVDPSGRLPLLARAPPVEAERGRAAQVALVAKDSPAAREGMAAGDVILSQRRQDGARQADLEPLPGADAAERLRIWRDLYLTGVSGPIVWRVRSGSGTRELPLARSSIRHGAARAEWARRHLGPLIQIVVFTAAALALLLIRSNDRTAALSVVALALSAVGGGGPLFGVEQQLPVIGPVLTIFTWVASALAFPIISLAMLYFPKRSALLERHPRLHAVPFVIAAPMIVFSLMAALYVSGIEAARSAVVWDVSHPAVYTASFAAALGLNLLVMLEGIHRFKVNANANERRRIRMALYTAVPGVLAYALKDGLPLVGRLAGFDAPEYPASSILFLQALVLMPAFGLVYAIGVARVLGPRVVLRRSLQYALASRTLGIVALLPALALVATLAGNRDRTIRELATGSSGVYIALTIASVAALRYRDSARRWLEQRFFREEYDAQRLLLSLANRVRFETNPADLASMVVGQIDEALHPETTAILVTGIDEGRLTPVAVLHGTADSLPIDGGLIAMLRWSDEPLEIEVSDPRSPAHRLPAEEREWLECMNVALLVPVVGQDRALIAVIALGDKRSEEGYSAEDWQLLASIASQMGLGFDVARLRLRAETPTATSDATTRLREPAPLPMAECPQCGRCEDAAVTLCPSDGTPMSGVASIPRVVDNKYRVEQRLGRGGMGAVYRARDVRLDRLVAVKVVRPELLDDPEARQRFRREAQIIARLQHPAIVSIFDFGTLADGGAYLVMEMVRGEDLRRVLQREGRFDSARALPILSTICGAIEAAHREGVLHRDLKPENIVLQAGDVAAKVLDFGVAKMMTPGGAAEGDGTLVTMPGAIIGTPAYMAPEQFHGVQPDARTDVFSLGVIAYEMLSGELPFGRGPIGEVIVAHVRGAQPMPRGLASGAIERAVLAALESDPARRPQTPEAFARMLESAGA